MLHSVLLMGVLLVAMTGQHLDRVRVGHPVLQIQHTFLALPVCSVAASYRRLILETERAEADAELGAQLATARPPDPRPLLHVCGAIDAQIEPLTHDIAEFEDVSRDLVRADLLLLEQLYGRLLLFTHDIPVGLLLCPCRRRLRVLVLRADLLALLVIEQQVVGGALGTEQVMRLRCCVDSSIDVALADLAQALPVLEKPVTDDMLGAALRPDRRLNIGAALVEVFHAAIHGL